MYTLLVKLFERLREASFSNFTSCNNATALLLITRH